MSSVAIVTDSNSGIVQAEAEKLGIYVLPMPFYINGELFYEDISLTQEEFYRHLQENSDISTSMPMVGDVTDLWDRLLKNYDEIVHIPMSSGLSSSCSTAIMLAKDYENQVYVVDNKRISVTQKQSVFDAKRMADAGWTAKQIQDKLLDEMYESSIYITLETLYYLKKGGRITPAAAALGSLLHLKPVLQIQGEKLDSYAKSRTKKAARAVMIDAMRKDFKERFHTDENADDFNIDIAYTGAYSEEVESWKNEVEDAFPTHKGSIMTDPLSLSVSCHIGHGALAIACSRKVDGDLSV
ncbi:MAG: DegV family protein [Lachnospiraceae bacterium]|nr:DegV family protein [Lachnospiraceae bacterium]